MKLKEIPNNTVVHTPTEEEAKELLAILHENGYEWYCSGKEEGWENFGDETCYRINSKAKVYHTCDREWYETICLHCILPVLTLAEFKEKYCEMTEQMTEKAEESSVIQEKPQPKFKVGDKVKIVNVRNPMMRNKIGIIEEHSTKNSPLYKVKWAEDSSTFIEDVFLEPYAEPETKEETINENLIVEKELNLCELLKGYEGETIFLTALGNVIIHSVSERSVQFKTHETAKDLYSLPSNGKMNENGLVIAFPSRALYEQYPLDPYTVWMEWHEKQKKYTLAITWNCPDRERAESIKHINFHTPADRDKCIEEIKAIINKYSK